MYIYINMYYMYLQRKVGNDSETHKTQNLAISLMANEQ